MLEMPKVDPSDPTQSKTEASKAGEALETTTRRRRKRPVRSRSIRVARASKREIEHARLRLRTEPLPERPRTRAECKSGPRPCPHVSCKHHLYLDVSPYTGTIKINFPDIEVWEMRVSCALDIADHGGMRLEDVGELMNVTRERARQIEIQALAKLELGDKHFTLRDYVE